MKLFLKLFFIFFIKKNSRSIYSTDFNTILISDKYLSFLRFLPKKNNHNLYVFGNLSDKSIRNFKKFKNHENVIIIEKLVVFENLDVHDLKIHESQFIYFHEILSYYKISNIEHLILNEYKFQDKLIVYLCKTEFINRIKLLYITKCKYSSLKSFDLLKNTHKNLFFDKKFPQLWKLLKN